MKDEIYSLRTEKKELKNKNSKVIEKNSTIDSTILTEKKDTETQTVDIKDSKDNTSYAKSKFQGIGCKYLNNKKWMLTWRKLLVCSRGKNI